MAYQSVSFTAGEVLTATKMNAIGTDLDELHNGTGLADGAITGSKVANETISSDNINWATVQSVAMPVARNITSVGYGLLNASFMRIGNVVHYSLPDTVSAETLPEGRTALSETVPEGYRPSSRLYGANGLEVPTVTTDGASPNRTLGHRFMPDGSIVLQTPNGAGAIAGQTRYVANATWITDDTFPAADIVPSSS